MSTVQISLNGLQAPRLARKDGSDEAFAWASRDALRLKCIGKSVSFVVERIDGMSKREYGSVWLASGENLSESIVVRALGPRPRPVTACHAAPLRRDICVSGAL